MRTDTGILETKCTWFGGIWSASHNGQMAIKLMNHPMMTVAHFSVPVLQHMKTRAIKRLEQTCTHLNKILHILHKLMTMVKISLIHFYKVIKCRNISDVSNVFL